MPISLLFLVLVVVLAVAVATFVLVTDRERRAVIDRANGFSDGFLVLKPKRTSLGDRLSKWLTRRLPSSFAAKGETASTLVHAGFDGPTAPMAFAAARAVSAVVLPLLAFTLMPRSNALYFSLAMVLGVVIGVLAPPAVLANLARGRQDKIKRSLPDCLDLMVVCVEAGVSLDAAVLRVARELGPMHPELAAELMTVNRRVNAGIPRDQAMHGLWLRTGVEELRALSANMIQSEKWGTSIATVLRVFAETLRRKRKQTAEKKAATAPLKMMIPLALFIFPTIFIVLMGPAIIKINTMFDTMK